MLLRRVPFTATTIAAILLVAAISGALFSQLFDHPWGDDVAYGLPSLVDGRLWTLLTGALFAVTPLCYVAVIGSFAVLTGFAEHRLGTRRTILACGYGHLVGILGAALINAIGATHWSATLDVGFSAGALGAAAIATASLPRRPRLLARAGLLAYCLAALLVLGELADLEHLVAVAACLPVGRFFLRRPVSSAHDAIRARALLARYGGTSLSWMTTWPGARYLVAADGYLAYRQHLGVAITIGDPVGSPAWRARALTEFAAMCERSGLTPCAFSITRDVARPAGWRDVQVAEDTLIDLATLEFRGKPYQDVRTARNRAVKEGVEHRLTTLGEAPPDVLAQVREISAEWLRRKRTPQLGFTLGGVDEALHPHVRVSLAVDRHGTVHGFTSWLPFLGPDGAVRGWTLDLMRKRTNGFRPTIDFLIASACLEFQAEGASVVSLSGAPLARTTVRHNPCLGRVLDILGAAMEPLYGFRSLHAYKAKFQPRPQALHLAYRRPTDLPRIGVALLRAYLTRTAAPVPAPPRLPAPRTATRQDQLAVA
jgi:hypothetical protein